MYHNCGCFQWLKLLISFQFGYKNTDLIGEEWRDRVCPSCQETNTHIHEQTNTNQLITHRETNTICLLPAVQEISALRRLLVEAWIGHCDIHGDCLNHEVHCYARQWKKSRYGRKNECYTDCCQISYVWQCRESGQWTAFIHYIISHCDTQSTLHTYTVTGDSNCNAGCYPHASFWSLYICFHHMSHSKRISWKISMQLGGTIENAPINQ